MVKRRLRGQKRKEDDEDDDPDDVSDEESVSPTRKSKSKKGLVKRRSRGQKRKEDDQDEDPDDVSDAESASPPRKSKAKKGHHAKDDSQSKKRKSKGKTPPKDQDAAPASVKRKTPPSGTRTVAKYKGNKGNLDGSGSDHDDSDFEKTPASKKQRIKKGKKKSRISLEGVNNDVAEDFEDNDARTPSRYVRISSKMSSYRRHNLFHHRKAQRKGYTSVQVLVRNIHKKHLMKRR